MLDISQIFQNTSGDLNDDDIQRMIDSIGLDDQLDDTLLSYLMGGEIPSFDQGGKVPMYLSGGTNFDTTSPTILVNGQFVPNPNYIDPTLSPQKLTSPIVNSTTNNLGINNLGVNYLEGVNHTGTQRNNNPYLQDIGFKKPAYEQPIVGQGFTEKDALAALRQSANPVEGENKEEESDEKKDFRESFLSTLNSDTSMSIEDGLYKAGEALAFNPSDDIYKNAEGEVNKTAKGLGQGFNILKGVAAGGKVLLGGARNMMEGFSYQKKNDIIENERKRREILARKNANTRNAEDGGEIPFFNDGGYLQYLENGDPVSPFTQDEDVRPSEQAPRELDLKGVQYYVYGEGNNTRMVPKSVVDNNPNSVYRTGEWNNQQFSSATQQGIRQEAVKRYESAPTNIKNLPKDEVIRMQQVLIDSGYDIGKMGADGIAGTRTRRALEQMRANDPETYKTWINTDFEPVISSVPSNRVQAPTKIQNSQTQASTKAQAQAPAKVHPQTAQTKGSTKPQVQTAQTPRGNVNIKNGQYYKDTNKITYKGKAYTPYQFLSLVKNMESNPMTNTFGAPEEMITLLNTALAANNKSLVKGRSVGYGNWKNQRPQFTTEDARKKYMGYDDGGEIPFFNDGGYLEFLEDGTNDMYSEMGPQDPREQMPLPQEMTGEYIQQQPQEAGIQPNAEIETDEYVQHPDGEVQQVEGRDHKEGGERVALEPGARVVSDNLKLGAKNAKILSQDYGIKVKANDTFATAISRYTKKIGLEELNSQQEEYFSKLKKDSKTRSEETSELNSQYLSEKINGIEQKKGLLEQLRSSFTDHVYNLQEAAKPSDTSKKKDLPSPEDIAQAMEMANDQPSMENGGLIRSFAGGGEVGELLARAMKNMKIDIESEAGKKLLEDLINQEAATGLNAEKLYGVLKSNSPLTILPKNYKEFKNSRWKEKIFEGEDTFELLDANYKPKSTTPKTGNRPGSNTSKTLGSSPTTILNRNSKGENYTSSNGNPLGNPEVIDSQEFTDTGEPITTSGKITKENLPTVNEYLYKSFPGARKFFEVEEDSFGRKVNPKIKDVKGYQTYLNDVLKPSLTKWGRDNIKDAKELDNYFNALDQFDFRDKDKGTRKIDGVFGNFSANKSPIKWKFVTPTEKKELDKLGVSQVSDLYDETGKLKSEYDFLSQESKDRLNKTREYEGLDMYIDEMPEVPEAPDNEQTPIDEYEKPLEKTYTRPILPDMSLEPPRPMDAHAKNQRRFVLNDAIEMSPENQINEMYRQADATADQFTGLTDTQRAAALSNLGANTQQNVAQAISGVEAANVQIRNQVNQANNAIINTEENARVADAQRYEELQMTAKAKTQQDYDDFMDKNREIRIKRFNYLTKDRQINDIAENFKTDANGSIMFDPATGLPLKLPGVTSKGQTEEVVKETRNTDGSITREIITRPIGTKTKTK